MKQTEPFPNRALSQEHLQKEDGDVWKPFFPLLLVPFSCCVVPWQQAARMAVALPHCKGQPATGRRDKILPRIGKRTGWHTSRPLFMLKDCLSPSRVGQSPWVTRASFARGGKEASWRVTGASSLLTLSPPPVCLLHRPVLKWCCRTPIQYRKEEAGLQQVRTITFFPSST